MFDRYFYAGQISGLQNISAWAETSVLDGLCHCVSDEVGQPVWHCGAARHFRCVCEILQFLIFLMNQRTANQTVAILGLTARRGRGESAPKTSTLIHLRNQWLSLKVGENWELPAAAIFSRSGADPGGGYRSCCLLRKSTTAICCPSPWATFGHNR